MTIETLQPSNVFYWFKEISNIPRCSKHEEKISEFLVNFAKERNLEVFQDHERNVIIKKPATPGFEHKQTIILQGHMDMVCEKVTGSNHDFSTDPLELVVNDGWLSAKDTTLGGDDGIAVAYILSILDGDYEHPNLEALITTQEELGMEGAQAVTAEHLTGKYLFNIDGEIEGEVFVGCAGGINIFSDYQIERQVSTLEKSYRIVIDGLTGGHSGQEIEKSRANAIKILARLVDNFPVDLEIVEIKGGTKHNAIPTNAEAIVKLTEAGIAELESRKEALINERAISDPNMTIVVEENDRVDDQVWTASTYENIIGALICMPDGILYMNAEFTDIVETSICHGIMYEEDGIFKLVALLRSSKKSLEVEQKRRYELLMKQFSFDLSDNGGYPCWEYDPASKLTPQVINIFKAKYGHEPKVKLIHCGLECGILKQALTDVDMITFGPDMTDVHTVNEKLNVESVARTWEFVKELLVQLD